MKYLINLRRIQLKEKANKRDMFLETATPSYL